MFWKRKKVDGKQVVKKHDPTSYTDPDEYVKMMKEWVKNPSAHPEIEKWYREEYPYRNQA